LYSIGIQLDGISELLRQGEISRMPGVGTNEALQFIGSDRQILRGFAESDDSYIARLRGAFDAWKLAGNPQSLVPQILGYLTPSTPRIRYVATGTDVGAGTHYADWITFEAGSTTYHRAEPTNWDWDGSFSDWRFWIIIYAIPSIWQFRHWGDGSVWGNPTESWGSTATPEQATDIRSLVSKWKCAGTIAQNIIVAGDTSLFSPTAAPGAPMPDGTWGNPWKITGGVYVPSREPNALYWNGVTQ
jgi:hypothetical protein